MTVDTPRAKKDARSREQLLQEIDRLRNGGVIEQVGLTDRTVVRALFVGFIAYQ